MGQTITNSLQRALDIQRKAARLGFDWPDIGPVLDKVSEELNEVREALALGKDAEAKEEVGDLLFSVVNLSRFVNGDPSTLLDGCSDRFSMRFSELCSTVERKGKHIQEYTLEELDVMWEEVKRNGA